MKKGIVFGLFLFLVGGLAALTGPTRGYGETLAAEPQSDQTPTFYRDVLPIFQARCQECHRPGEIGPMGLLTYEETRPWARSIREAVLLREMPPWFPSEEGHSEFLNDPSLSDEEIRTLVEWVDGGSDAGDPADAPEPVEWVEGFRINPDLVVASTTPMKIPAVNPTEDDLQFVTVIRGQFPIDTWVSAVELSPSDRSVVHHAGVSIRPPDSSYLAELGYDAPLQRAASSRDPSRRTRPQATPEGRGRGGPGRGRGAPGGGLLSTELLANYIPGISAQKFDQWDSAKFVPAGSDIIVQPHVIPNGEDPVDLTFRVGMEIANEVPEYRYITSLALSNLGIQIPANASNHEEIASSTLSQDAQLVWLKPHMHLRGKDMSFRVTYPDGRTETIFKGDFDYSWQFSYDLANPVELPKGTRLEAIAHWDNSANNPFNPDPNSDIWWGDNASDEMLTGWVGIVVPATSENAAQALQIQLP